MINFNDYNSICNKSSNNKCARTSATPENLNNYNHNLITQSRAYYNAIYRRPV